MVTMFGMSPDPKQPLIVGCTRSSTPRARHSFLSQSTGTGDLPLAVFPQQHPWQTVPCHDETLGGERVGTVVIHDSWAKEIFGRHVNKSNEERIEKFKPGFPLYRRSFAAYWTVPSLTANLSR
jgi:hypothetical protein